MIDLDFSLLQSPYIDIKAFHYANMPMQYAAIFMAVK